jgi:hypothetical protein
MTLRSRCAITSQSTRRVVSARRSAPLAQPRHAPTERLLGRKPRPFTESDRSLGCPPKSPTARPTTATSRMDGSSISEQRSSQGSKEFESIDSRQEEVPATTGCHELRDVLETTSDRALRNCNDTSAVAEKRVFFGEQPSKSRSVDPIALDEFKLLLEVSIKGDEHDPLLMVVRGRLTGARWQRSERSSAPDYPMSLQRAQ